MTGETSPFHLGEQQIQTRLGVRDQIEPWARKVVRPFLPQQHRDFYSSLPYLVIAARDESGRPFVTLVTGEPGFARSSDPGSLTVAAQPSDGDAISGSIRVGTDIGILGIELHTRRRNRLNGRVTSCGESGFVVEVEQSFGNCPQYIHPRSWSVAPMPLRPSRAEKRNRLSSTDRQWIAEADTFFIASGYRGEGADPSFGMDASHRGGNAGFVVAEDDRSLVFPDYAGNNHYNTLGNLLVDPRAGLLFVDFEEGHLLELTGHATVDFDTPQIDRFPGARRLVRFELDELVELRNAVPLRFSQNRQMARQLRVVERRHESRAITSFYLAARDGGPLPSFAPGQHLPLELDIPGEDAPVSRTYSLSSPPGIDLFRISVKRESHGVASRHLHDQIEKGDIVTALDPAGEFTLDESSSRPVVLLGAGVGLTPLVSMLHVLAGDDTKRPVWFVYLVRDGSMHPLRDEVERLAARYPEIKTHFSYSQPRAEDRLGIDYQSRGRIDKALLEALVPLRDAEYYLCGPTGFMATMRTGLEELGVDPKYIFTESFGPGAPPVDLSPARYSSS